MFRRLLNDRKRLINLEFLTVLKGTITLFTDPSKTDSVYDVEDMLRHTKAMELSVQHLLTQPEVAQIIQERYIAPPPDIEALITLPEGSLGHAYATYIKEMGFDPGFYRSLEVEDDITYVLLRIRQTHDIWHIVTGFSVDVAGEIGLKAFELAQTRRTLAGILTAGGLIQCLFQAPQELDKLLEHIAVGYRMGATAKPFLAQKWEQHWEKPLAEWRTELQVESAPAYIR